jgi:hypothetical protein
LLLAFLALSSSAGCRGPERVASQDWIEFPPLAYRFETVWEVAIEAVQDEEFAIVSADRPGSFETRMKELVLDRISMEQPGVQVFVRLEQGEGEHRLDMAAVRFVRRYDSQGVPGVWEYHGAANEVVQKIKKRFFEILDERFQSHRG